MLPPTKLYFSLFLFFWGYLNINVFSQSNTYNEKVEAYLSKYKEELSSAPHEALKTAEELLEFVETEKDSFNIIRAHNSIAAYYMSLGEFDKAKKSYLQIIKLLDSNVVIPALNLGRIYNDFGVLYLNLKDNKMAIDYLLKAYQIRDSIQDPKLGSTLNNISFLYNMMGEYESALKFLQKTLQYREQNGDSLGVATILNNMGTIYNKQNEFDLAIKTSLKAISFITLNSQKPVVGLAYGNIGDAYINKEDYPKAVQYFQKQLLIGQTIQANDIVATAYLKLGNSFAKMGRYKESESYLLEGLRLSQEIGSNYLEEDFYFALSRMFEIKQDFKKALQYNQRYYIFVDSLNTAESKKSTAALSSKFDALLAEKENKLLQKENKLKDIELEKFYVQQMLWFVFSAMLLIITGLAVFLYFYRTKTNKKLLKLNATKDKLFALVAHDLKNPLSAFRSITQTLKDNFDTINKNDVSFFIKKLNKSSNKLYDLLQNLLEWALNETGNITCKIVRVDLHEVVPEIGELLTLNAEEKQITLSNEIPQNSFVQADKKMLQTILRNLISNAIKFSPPNNIVRIHCNPQGDNLNIHVTDNGLGISKEDQKKLFLIHEDVSTVGDSKEKGTGLGLILCKELITRQLGSIWVESAEGVGSTFSFSLPLDN